MWPLQRVKHNSAAASAPMPPGTPYSTRAYDPAALPDAPYTTNNYVVGADGRGVLVSTTITDPKKP
jgi:hypothetical protein